MQSTAIIVPARLGSQRFPRKLLHQVKGVPLILWTARRLREVAPEMPLYFAVAEEELAQVLQAEGFETILTDPDLPSGTDRLAVANQTLQAKVVINVQADEPLISQGHIRQLAALMERNCDMATLAVAFCDKLDYEDPNKVKVVRARDGRALYFTRSTIPYPRDTQGQLQGDWLATAPVYWHMGIYAYTADFLDAFRRMPPGELESIEKLEQLRALENGYTIQVGISVERSVGIDVPADVRIFEAALISA